jgi:ABC-type nitrate/sulfonate/bicarbonate transport system permease component
MSRASELSVPSKRRHAARTGYIIQSDIAVSMLSIVTIILLWQIVASVFYTPTFFPTPVIVFQKGVEMCLDGTIFPNIGASLARIMAGFVIGSAAGAPIGLLMGTWRPFRAFFEPYVQFFRFIPSIAWLTPAVIWFGIGETPKVLIIVYTTVFIVIINTVVGVSNVATNKLWAARSLGANRFQEFVYVVLPATLPFILTGMRLAMGNSFATVVAAEMIAADTGLGFLIFNSRLWMATDTIFVSIALLGFLGLGADRLFRFTIYRFAHQYGPAA